MFTNLRNATTASADTKAVSSPESAKSPAGGPGRYVENITVISILVLSTAGFLTAGLYGNGFFA